MSQAAFVADGRVSYVLPIMEKFDLADCVHAEDVYADGRGFVVAPNDVEEGMLYDGRSFKPAPPPPPPPPPCPIVVDRRQFFTQAALDGDVTEDEALAAMTGALPDKLSKVIDDLPSDQRFSVRMAAAGNSFNRLDPIVARLAESMGKTPEQVLKFWTAAGQL